MQMKKFEFFFFWTLLYLRNPIEKFFVTGFQSVLLGLDIRMSIPISPENAWNSEIMQALMKIIK